MYHATKTYWRTGGIAPSILNLGSRWIQVVTFTPQPLYLGEITPIPTGEKAGWAPEPVWT